jgi:peptide/nickel transport system permease protein
MMARSASAPLRLARRYPVAAGGAVILLAAAVVAVFATELAPYGQFTQVGVPFGAPTAHHLLGLTDTGSDELSQLILGARISMLVGASAAVIAVVLGGTLGLVAGYFGGRVDGIIGRIVDYLLVFPVLPLAIVVATLWGPSLRNVVLLIGLLSWPPTTRLIRSQVKSIAHRVFVARARSLGSGSTRIIVRHVLPSVGPLLAAAAVISIGNAIFFEAALAFLGLSDPSSISWGAMIANAFERGAATAGAWWVVVPPGAAIGVVVLGATLLGRAVEDALNPRLKRANLVSKGSFRIRGTGASPIPPAVRGVAPVLELSHLDVRFASSGGDVHAVRDVSLRVARGERFGLVGESGCGKSTSLLTAMGLLPASATVSGTVLVNGIDILAGGEAGIQQYRWTSLAMVFQGAMNAFNPVRTIRRQIREPLLLHGVAQSHKQADNRIDELFGLVGLPITKADSFPHELSGGMRQRAALAMALACSPDVLLADEPTTALDVMVQARILALLAHLSDELGLAVVLVTHDLPIITEFCDRAAVMYAGEIVEEATTDVLRSSPQHPYTRRLFEATPDLYGSRRVLSIPGAPPRLDRPIIGCPFAPRCDQVLEVCRTVTPVDIAIDDVGHTARCHRCERESERA